MNRNIENANDDFIPNFENVNDDVMNEIINGYIAGEEIMVIVKSLKNSKGPGIDT